MNTKDHRIGFDCNLPMSASLLVDGMGSPTTGLDGLRGHTVIHPGVNLGLIDGLAPADFASAVAAIFIDSDKKAANDDSVGDEA